MNKLRDKFAQFMVGRYGIDQLYYALIVLYLVCFVLNIIFPKIMVFGILTWVVLIISFFRVFSRNVYKRSQENAVFVKVWDKVKGFFSLTFSKIKDFPSKKYTKCPHCHSVLRLPRQRGKHTVRCPRCSNRFEIKIMVGAKTQGKNA